MARACGWDIIEKLKKFGAMNMNVFVISFYFFHCNAITGYLILVYSLISPFPKHQQGTFKTNSDGMQDIQKHS